MQTVEEIIEQARHLSPQDRQRLVASNWRNYWERSRPPHQFFPEVRMRIL